MAAAAARATPSTGSGSCSAAARNASPNANRAWLSAAMDADERHLEVFVNWQCAQHLRAVYHQPTAAACRRLATNLRVPPHSRSPGLPAP